MYKYDTYINIHINIYYNAHDGHGERCGCLVVVQLRLVAGARVD